MPSVVFGTAFRAAISAASACSWGLPSKSASEAVEVLNGPAPSSRLKVEPETKDEARRQLLNTKLHPALLAAYKCSVEMGSKHCDGVKDGKVKVQIWLDNATPQLKQELANAGLLIDGKTKGPQFATGLQLLGEVAIDRLPQLAAVAHVKLIALAK